VGSELPRTSKCPDRSAPTAASRHLRANPRYGTLKSRASVAPQPRVEVPGRDRRVRVTPARLASFTCGPKTRPKMTATFSRE
jgi:hypothetical protein